MDTLITLLSVYIAMCIVAGALSLLTLVVALFFILRDK